MKTVENNRLFIDGVSCSELRESYKTPLIVYSRSDIKKRIGEIKRDFLEKYPGTKCAYAAKAFLCLEMCRIIKEEGLSLDVVSMGELALALKAGFPAERIEFNGNNKSKEEISEIVKRDVGRVIVDGTDELELLEAECKRQNKTASCLLRISPGVDSHTHRYITTGHIDSKFGIPLERKIFNPIFERALNSPYIRLLGFHFHVGSQLLENSSHIKATVVLLDLINELNAKYGFIPKELNIGGGFGIKYTPKDIRPSYSSFLDAVMKLITEGFDKMGMAVPSVVIEPGRSIVGEAAVTLYTIGSIKEIPGVRKYAAVDGGMTDNIRPALYDALYTAVNAENVAAEDMETITICGNACESGDILIKDISLPKLKRGDLLAVFSTGAYCYSMASNYNMHTKPAVVMTENAESRLIIKRQSIESLWENDCKL